MDRIKLKIALLVFLILLGMWSCRPTMNIPADELQLQKGDRIISYVRKGNEATPIPVTTGQDEYAGAYIYSDTLFIKTKPRDGQPGETGQKRINLSDIRSVELKRNISAAGDSLEPAIMHQIIRKNIFYVEGETGIVLSNLSVNFERVFLAEKPLHFSLGGGVGAYYRYEEPNYYLFSASSGPIYKLSSHLIWEGGFEIGLGISVLNCLDCSHLEEKPWKSDYKVHPIISLGWRLQNTPFFLKTHLGSWGIGLGLGYSF